MKNLLLLISFIILLSACNQIDQQKTPVYNIDLENLSKEPLNLNNLIEDVEIIPLETSDNSLLVYINGINLFDDKIIIYDGSNKKILAFDEQGNFLHPIGKIGKGPGEYQYPYKPVIVPNKNHISFIDIRTRKLMTFTTAGEFVDDLHLSLNGSSLAYLGDSIIAVHTGRMRHFQGNHLNELWMINKKGEIVDSLFPFPALLDMDLSNIMHPKPETKSALYTKIGDYSIHEVFESRHDTLYKFDFGDANLDTANYLGNNPSEPFFTQTNVIFGFTSLTNTDKELTAGVHLDNNPKAIIVVNHKSKKSKTLATDSIGFGRFNDLTIPIPKWSNTSHQFGYLNALDWNEILEKLTANQKEILRKKISGFQEAENIDPEDNPILVKFKFKDF